MQICQNNMEYKINTEQYIDNNNELGLKNNTLEYRRYNSYRDVIE